MRPVAFFLPLLLILSAAAIAFVPFTPFLPVGFQRVEIPFTLNAEREIIVQGEIGLKPISLIVDTGMDAPVALSLSFCSKANLPLLEDDATLHFFGEPDEHVAQVLRGFILNLQGEGFPIEGAVRLRDFSSFTRSPEKYEGAIGWGFLSRFHVIIDYPSRKIILLNPTAEAPSSAGGISLAEGPVPVVRTRLFGKEVALLLDTASTQSWISYEFLEKQKVAPAFPLDGKDFKGNFRVASLQVDQATLQNVSFNVVGNFSSHSRSDAFQGILGSNVLSGMTVQLDASRRVAGMTPGPWQPTDVNSNPSAGGSAVHAVH